MPDMTKEAPDPEGSSTATADPEPDCDGKPCAECGWHHHGPKHYARVGSKKWFWLKRVENLMLFGGPAIPLALGLGQLIRPTLTVSLDDKQEAAINGAYEMPGQGASTVNRVIVQLDDPSIAERLIAAGPALLFGALLAFVAYALWRIEINLSANGKYTAKDSSVLMSASRWLWRGWFFLIAAELAVSFWFREAPASESWFFSSVTTSMGDASLVALILTGFMGVVARIYRSGSKAYAELEKGV